MFSRHYECCPQCNKVKSKSSKYCSECRAVINRSPVTYDILTVDGEPCRQLPLTRSLYAIVDASRYDEFMDGWRWMSQFASGKFYAIGYPIGESATSQTMLHHLVLKMEIPDEVDHINRNPLDNRRSNLRLATSSQNAFNRSQRPDNTTGYRGVSWHKVVQKWAAKICYCGKQKHLGVFDTPEEAALVYDSAAIELHGEFASLNFPRAVI